MATKPTTRRSLMPSCDCTNLAMGVAATALVLFVFIFGWVTLVSPVVLDAANGDGWSNLVEVDSSLPQAVFLTNGQVYFGNITGATADVFKLENVHYLQVEEPAEALTGEATEGEESADETTEEAVTTDNGLSLVELGTTEVHSPANLLMIERDQVLYWENLTAESAVTKAMQ